MSTSAPCSSSSSGSPGSDQIGHLHELIPQFSMNDLMGGWNKLDYSCESQ
jgi:hypothetical protein